MNSPPLSDMIDPLSLGVGPSTNLLTPRHRRPGVLRSTSSFSFSDEDDEPNIGTDDSSDTSDASEESSLSASSLSSSTSSLSLSSFRSSQFRSRHPSQSSDFSVLLPASPSSVSSSSIQGGAFPPMQTRSRKQIKTALALLQARRALGNQTWGDLWNALLSIDAALKAERDLETLGAALPVFARIAHDISNQVLAEKTHARDHRRSLPSLEAKSLSVLCQKWPKLAEEPHWIGLKARVAQIPPHRCLSYPLDQATTHLLNSLEALLLLGSSRRLSLSKMGLTQIPEALEKLDEILDWYLGFEINNVEERERRRHAVLGGVRTLDLGRNELTTLPSKLADLLPNLHVLNLAHNPWPGIPTSVTRFRHLQKILIKGYKRRKGNLGSTRRSIRAWATDVSTNNPQPMRAQTVPPLSVSCIRVLQKTEEETTSLAPHLQETIKEGYTCSSCQNFILPSTPLHLAPIFETVHLLDPGVPLPAFLSPPIPSTPPSPSASSLYTVPFFRYPASSPAAMPPHLLSPQDRVVAALLGKGLEITSVVLGPRRLCARCAREHLVVSGDGTGEAWQGEDAQCCRCDGCEEERRVLREDAGLRWFRKKGERGRL